MIITARPHGEMVFKGTGNKYIISRGLMQRLTGPSTCKTTKMTLSHLPKGHARARGKGEWRTGEQLQMTALPGSWMRKTAWIADWVCLIISRSVASATSPAGSLLLHPAVEV